MKRLKALGVIVFAFLAFGVSWAKADINVINHSSNLTDAQVLNALPAFQDAVDKDFAPYWFVSQKLVFSDHYQIGSWNIELVDTTDVEGAAGYHTLVRGSPYAMVGTKEGMSWQLVFSHELFEMLADPFTDRASSVWHCYPFLGCTSDTFYLVEVADPVEWKHLAYNRPGADGKPVIISDFVTENWYSGQSGKMDFMGYVHRHHQILKHGYAVANTENVWNFLDWRRQPTNFFRK